MKFTELIDMVRDYLSEHGDITWRINARYSVTDGQPSLTVELWIPHLHRRIIANSPQAVYDRLVSETNHSDTMDIVSADS